MNESIDTSLIRSIATQSLADVLVDVSETSIDAALNSGILREIPIVGTITKVLQAGSDIKSALFLRKVTLFLKEVSEVSDINRKKFVTEITTPEEQHRFGEAILLLLERSDDMKKPKLIAKMLNAHILGYVEQSVAFRICAMINRCYVQDLELLKCFTKGLQGKNDDIAASLFSDGFLSSYGADHGDLSNPDSGGELYQLSRYGEIVVEHVLNE